jgi:DNA ligase-associated metallophosphoesterase
LAERAETQLIVAGVPLCAALSGVLYWPAKRVLAVADLHLEKSTTGRPGTRGVPPYDTRDTLVRLGAAIKQYAPTHLVALGDSFHDPTAVARMDDADLAHLRALASGLRWIWITGNHDPAPPWFADLSDAVGEWRLGPLVFRHQAKPDMVGEISGHYHPKAAVQVRGGRVKGHCFAEDGNRLIMPAFGSYTGGLNVLDPAIQAVFGGPPARCHVIGRRSITTIPAVLLRTNAH